MYFYRKWWHGREKVPIKDHHRGKGADLHNLDEDLGLEREIGMREIDEEEVDQGTETGKDQDLAHPKEMKGQARPKDMNGQAHLRDMNGQAHLKDMNGQGN